MSTSPPTPSQSPNPAHPLSPWVRYLIEKTPAANFLKDMAEGIVIIVDPKTGKSKKQKTNAISIPDEATRLRFVAELQAKPERVERLIQLLQTSTIFSNTTIRRIVLELAETAIVHLKIGLFPEPLDAAAFNTTVTTWLEKIADRPLKTQDMQVLWLLIHVGRQRNMLDEDTTFKLIAMATSRKIPPPSVRIPTLLDILLAVKATPSVTTAVITYFNASKASVHKLKTTIQAQAEKIAYLTDERTTLNATISSMQAEYAALKAQKEAADIRIADRETEIVQVRDGYKHQIYELRERIRGVLEGQLSRWLQNALDASQSNPPWIAPIQERLEDALKLLKREITWLRPSD